MTRAQSPPLASKLTRAESGLSGFAETLTEEKGSAGAALQAAVASTRSASILISHRHLERREVNVSDCFRRPVLRRRSSGSCFFSL
jgi:hypothetical protein